MITILSDVILPESVMAAGVAGRNMRNNTRAMSGSGDATIIVNWQRTLRQYELGIVPMDIAAWQQIEALHELTAGGALGFLMADPKNSTIGAGAGVLQPLNAAGASVGTAGLGYGVPTYQLMQRTAVAGSSAVADRRITRPSTAAILRGGGAVSPTVTLGVATFAADASEAITSIATGASTVLNFASGAGVVAQLAVGQRVYVSGTSGTAAAVLNGSSHAITAKGASSLTISTSTATLSATGGTAAKYVQPTETLTWTGGFYIPVHFLDDEIEWQILRSGPVADRIVSGPRIVLQEVRE